MNLEEATFITIMLYSMPHKDENKTPPRKSKNHPPPPTLEDIQHKFLERSFKHQLLEQWGDLKKKVLFVPAEITRSVVSGEVPFVVTTEETFKVSFPQRLFLLFDQPEECFLGEAISFVTMIVIMISCIGYIASTGSKEQPSSCAQPACENDPTLCPDSVICPPEDNAVYELIETVCIVFFTIDYFTRLFLVPLMPARCAALRLEQLCDACRVYNMCLYFRTVLQETSVFIHIFHFVLFATCFSNVRLAGILPSYFDMLNSNGIVPVPEYSVPVTIWRYMTMPMNLIDLVAILPFYVAYFSTSGSSVSIIRILRLVRVLRVFKMGGLGNGVTLMSNAIMNSISAMGILLFFTVLGVILFGSIIFFLEAGVFEVTEVYPEGAFLRWNVMHTAKEESPFSSILVSCYWAMVTFTTVGYGDFVPTSPFGRFVALILMYTGILVLALPISVIGANFQREYERLNGVNDDLDDDEDENGSVCGSVVGGAPLAEVSPTARSPTSKRALLRTLSSSTGSARPAPALEVQVERLVRKALLHRERSNSSFVHDDDSSPSAQQAAIQEQLRVLTSTCALLLDRMERLQQQQQHNDVLAQGAPLRSDDRGVGAKPTGSAVAARTEPEDGVSTEKGIELSDVMSALREISDTTSENSTGCHE